MVRKTAELQQKYPVAYSRALAELIGPIVNEKLDFVRYYALPEFKPQMVRTFWMTSEVINRAKVANWDVYSPFSNDAKTFLTFEIKMYRRLMPEGQMRMERDFSNIDDVLAFFLDLLNSYKRRVAYLCALLDIEEGSSPDVVELDKRPPWTLEERIREAYANRFVLGSEYIHLRNSLAHGSCRILHESRVVKFSDRDWEKEYSYPVLVATIQHAWSWMVGWEVAYNYHQLLAAMQLHLEPKSLRQCVELQ